MEDTRIPRKDNLFDQYIRNTTTALEGSVVPPLPPIPPWQRLLLNPAEFA